MKIDTLIAEVKKQPNFIKATDYIYTQYANIISGDTKKKVDLGKVDESPVYDKGWFFNNKGESYFKKTGKYLLKKGTDYVTVSPEEFIKDYKNTDNFNFTVVSIQIKKYEINGGWIWLNGGKYLGFNNRLRFYFSFEKNDTSKVAEFIKQLSELLDLKELPYKIKLEESLTSRNENAVLYFNKSNYYLVFMIVHFMYNKYRNEGIFRDGKFEFVKTFDKFKALAFAEDPNGTSSSFGETIANLYAQAILIGKISNEKELKKYVQKQGYDFDKLYLNPNTNFEYSFEIFKDDTNSADGLMYLENEFEGNQNLKIIHKVAMVIIKNAIIYRQNGKTKCDWMKTVYDPIWLKETDCYLCNDNEKIEILEFLAAYLAFIASVGDSDKIILRIANTAYETVNRRNLTQDFKKKRLEIKKMLGGGYGGPTNTPRSLFEQLQSADFEAVKNAVAKIKYNFDERGIVSYLPDDEFNPTQKDNGYAYLGMVLLKRFKEGRS